MNTPSRIRPIINIAKYTFADEVRQRSFVVMFVICVISIFLTRGCYQGNYMVNGQALDAGAVVGAVSKVTFHVIAVAVMLLAALLSMRVFRRDRDDGMQSSILSKPITRRQYVMGKILGLWALSTLFMFILHAVLFVIVSVTLKEVVPGYLAASLLCSFNLLFVVVAVLLLSLFDAGHSRFSLCDGHRCRRPGNRRALCVEQQPDGDCDDAAIGRPRAVERVMGESCSTMYGRSFQGRSILRPRSSAATGFHGFGSIYPLINVLLYCLILGVLLFRRFGNEDIL